MAPSSLAQAVIDIADPVLYGYLMGICMFGICISQTWTYVRANDDTWQLRLVVVILFILVLVGAVLEAQVLLFRQVKNFGNFQALLFISSEMSAFTLVTTFVIVICDLCFATRIWRLQRAHWSFIAAIVITAMGALIAGLILADSVFRHTEVVSLADSINIILVAFVNILAAISQAIATGCLWYSLTMHMQEAGSTPQPIFQRLSTSIVIRGTLLTIIQLIIPILYLARPDRVWWEGLYGMLSPLYYMTTVAVLNTRYSPPKFFLPTAHNEYSTRSGSFVNGATENPGFLRFPQGVKVEPLPFGALELPEERPTPFTQLHSGSSQASEKSHPTLAPVHRGAMNATVEESKSEDSRRNSDATSLGAGMYMVRTDHGKEKGEQASASSSKSQPLRRLPALPARVK
ncbi:hypothetical protein V5O48_013371 [Marasmius crinis-equi]|uniref:DUF6534 domain-containing protein n=1 Tax=Marasmius crinis-equi TaxID=585013 RepID=A0ABR3F0N6_9AGAR